ncbi:MAG: 4-hydroxy-tetrahydrodipicolinate reductase [Thermomicrobiales bacterium]|nr:4-hydroxy-tetrahydrodipicolinate reductase [Thermomicrobiales bacterium]
MSEPLRIGIAGITGRMGREITALARNDERIRLVGGVSRREPADDLFTDLLVTSDLDRLLLEIDLLIDFTLPEATSSIAAAASRARVPLLCGVTGLGATDIAALESAAEHIPVHWSRNLSLALPLVADLVRQLAAALADFDVEITETHHRGKLEAPSGTALLLAEAVAAGRSQALDNHAIYGRYGVSPRTPGDIGIHALRAGSLPGEHTILFAGDEEELRITHRALSRRAFAQGAIEAAIVLAARPIGLIQT